jgi:c-di-AMP phosphodiesterase-like protein
MGNQMFFDMCGRSTPSFEVRLTDLVPRFSSKWLLEGKNRYSELLTIGSRKYQIHGNIIRVNAEEKKKDFMGITYWVDVTEYDDIKQEYLNSRPVVMMIVIDNYDELMKNVPERGKIDLRGEVEDRISHWVEGRNGFTAAMTATAMSSFSSSAIWSR